MLKYVTNTLLAKRIFNKLRTAARRTMSTEQDCIEGIVCHESDVPDEGMKEVQLGEGKVLLVKQKGSIYALGAKCTHYGAPMVNGVLGKGVVRCPWHGACFNLKSGDIEDFPGIDSLPCYKISVLKNGDVQVSAQKSVVETNIYRRVKPMTRMNRKSNQTIVIIGGGAAGTMCAEVLRQRGYDGRLILLAKEKFFYDRPKVSKNIDFDITKITIRKKEYYDSHDIEFMGGEIANTIDTSNKVVRTESGLQIMYTRAFIACGANAKIPSFIPGCDLENIFTLRTYQDSASLYSALTPESHVVVIGSSFIGMEAAAFCKSKVASVTVIGRSEVPFEMSLGKEIGRSIGNLFESKGVKMMNKATCDEFVGEGGKLIGVRVAGQVIPADICVVGLGIDYCTDFLKDTDIKLTKYGAIEVDEYMQTSNPDVYAGGDVAYAPVYPKGEKANIGHWQVAQFHGRTAAINMLGNKESIRSVPFFWSGLFGHGIRYAGHGSYDNIIINGDVEKLKFVAYYLKGNEVVAASSIASDPVVAQFAQWILEGKKLYKDNLADNNWYKG